ncbi:hypothetical protein [Dysgonomonas sp. 520]|uniref:hypothetical protein n=1 Tax=Dysgonomonas sp. 520 TaxID=2302931 RepID=UPI0013D20BE0|nr:hypothetical protein [Dysgonomonas sp. 520]NDW10299.1 hypothetical protein [Dysgonomonas sp. 520]
MKKIILLCCIIGTCIFNMQSQTYYKYIESVDENGVKEKLTNIVGVYIVFTDNGCYESDQNGYIKKFPDGSTSFYSYRYEGMSNGLHVYVKGDTHYNLYGQQSFHPTGYLYFSKDYNRINSRASEEFVRRYGGLLKNKTHVYQKGTPPGKAPQEFY